VALLGATLHPDHHLRLQRRQKTRRAIKPLIKSNSIFRRRQVTYGMVMDGQDGCVCRVHTLMVCWCCCCCCRMSSGELEIGLREIEAIAVCLKPGFVESRGERLARLI
jgi:hypothetical protein